MANGRVCTGFSKPYVALYKNTSGTISFENGMPLARGVNVDISPETGSDNIFYTDNQAAENDGGTFTGGTVTYTVDGLKPAAKKLIMGTGTAGEDGWTAYDDDQKAPYVATGFIARYMEDGTTTYQPYVIVKTTFNQIGDSAATSEDSINFQTQSLTAKIFRGDDAKHTWKYDGAVFTSEAEAEAALKTKLGIS